MLFFLISLLLALLPTHEGLHWSCNDPRELPIVSKVLSQLLSKLSHHKRKTKESLEVHNSILSIATICELPHQSLDLYLFAYGSPLLSEEEFSLGTFFLLQKITQRTGEKRVEDFFEGFNYFLYGLRIVQGKKAEKDRGVIFKADEVRQNRKAEKFFYSDPTAYLSGNPGGDFPYVQFFDEIMLRPQGFEARVLKKDTGDVFDDILDVSSLLQFYETGKYLMEGKFDEFLKMTSSIFFHQKLCGPIDENGLMIEASKLYNFHKLFKNLTDLSLLSTRSLFFREKSHAILIALREQNISTSLALCSHVRLAYLRIVAWLLASRTAPFVRLLFANRVHPFWTKQRANSLSKASRFASFVQSSLLSHASKFTELHNLMKKNRGFQNLMEMGDSIHQEIISWRLDLQNNYPNAAKSYYETSFHSSFFLRKFFISNNLSVAVSELETASAAIVRELDLEYWIHRLQMAKKSPPSRLRIETRGVVSQNPLPLHLPSLPSSPSRNLASSSLSSPPSPSSPSAPLLPPTSTSTKYASENDIDLPSNVILRAKLLLKNFSPGVNGRSYIALYDISSRVFDLMLRVFRKTTAVAPKMFSQSPWNFDAHSGEIGEMMETALFSAVSYLSDVPRENIVNFSHPFDVSASLQKKILLENFDELRKTIKNKLEKLRVRQILVLDFGRLLNACLRTQVAVSPECLRIGATKFHHHIFYSSQLHAMVTFERMRQLYNIYLTKKKEVEKAVKNLSKAYFGLQFEFQRIKNSIDRTFISAWYNNWHQKLRQLRNNILFAMSSPFAVSQRYFHRPSPLDDSQPFESDKNDKQKDKKVDISLTELRKERESREKAKIANMTRDMAMAGRELFEVGAEKERKEGEGDIKMPYLSQYSREIYNLMKPVKLLGPNFGALPLILPETASTPCTSPQGSRSSLDTSFFDEEKEDGDYASKFSHKFNFLMRNPNKKHRRLLFMNKLFYHFTASLQLRENHQNYLISSTNSCLFAGIDLASRAHCLTQFTLDFSSHVFLMEKMGTRHDRVQMRTLYEQVYQNLTSGQIGNVSRSIRDSLAGERPHPETPDIFYRLLQSLKARVSRKDYSTPIKSLSPIHQDLFQFYVVSQHASKYSDATVRKNVYNAVSKFITPSRLLYISPEMHQNSFNHRRLNRIKSYVASDTSWIVRDRSLSPFSPVFASPHPPPEAETKYIKALKELKSKVRTPISLVHKWNSFHPRKEILERIKQSANFSSAISLAVNSSSRSQPPPLLSFPSSAKTQPTPSSNLAGESAEPPIRKISSDHSRMSEKTVEEREGRDSKERVKREEGGEIWLFNFMRDLKKWEMHQRLAIVGEEANIDAWFVDASIFYEAINICFQPQNFMETVLSHIANGENLKQLSAELLTEFFDEENREKCENLLQFFFHITEQKDLNPSLSFHQILNSVMGENNLGWKDKFLMLKEVYESRQKNYWKELMRRGDTTVSLEEYMKNASISPPGISETRTSELIPSLTKNLYEAVSIRKEDSSPIVRIKFSLLQIGFRAEPSADEFFDAYYIQQKYLQPDAESGSRIKEKETFLRTFCDNSQSENLMLLNLISAYFGLANGSSLSTRQQEMKKRRDEFIEREGEYMDSLHEFAVETSYDTNNANDRFEHQIFFHLRNSYSKNLSGPVESNFHNTEEDFLITLDSLANNNVHETLFASFFKGIKYYFEIRGNFIMKLGSFQQREQSLFAERRRSIALADYRHREGRVVDAQYLMDYNYSLSPFARKMYEDFVKNYRLTFIKKSWWKILGLLHEKREEVFDDWHDLIESAQWNLFDETGQSEVLEAIYLDKETANDIFLMRYFFSPSQATLRLYVKNLLVKNSNFQITADTPQICEDCIKKFISLAVAPSLNQQEVVHHLEVFDRASSRIYYLLSRLKTIFLTNPKEFILNAVSASKRTVAAANSNSEDANASRAQEQHASARKTTEKTRPTPVNVKKDCRENLDPRIATSKSLCNLFATSLFDNLVFRKQPRSASETLRKKDAILMKIRSAQSSPTRKKRVSVLEGDGERSINLLNNYKQPTVERRERIIKNYSANQTFANRSQESANYQQQNFNQRMRNINGSRVKRALTMRGKSRNYLSSFPLLFILETGRRAVSVSPFISPERFILNDQLFDADPSVRFKIDAAMQLFALEFLFLDICPGVFVSLSPVKFPPTSSPSPSYSLTSPSHSTLSVPASFPSSSWKVSFLTKERKLATREREQREEREREVAKAEDKKKNGQLFDELEVYGYFSLLQGGVNENPYSQAVKNEYDMIANSRRELLGEIEEYRKANFDAVQHFDEHLILAQMEKEQKKTTESLIISWKIMHQYLSERSQKNCSLFLLLLYYTHQEKPSSNFHTKQQWSNFATFCLNVVNGNRDKNFPVSTLSEQPFSLLWKHMSPQEENGEKTRGEETLGEEGREGDEKIKEAADGSFLGRMNKVIPKWREALDETMEQWNRKEEILKGEKGEETGNAEGELLQRLFAAILNLETAVSFFQNLMERAETAKIILRHQHFIMWRDGLMFLSRHVKNYCEHANNQNLMYCDHSGDVMNERRVKIDETRGRRIFDARLLKRNLLSLRTPETFITNYVHEKLTNPKSLRTRIEKVIDRRRDAVVLMAKYNTQEKLMLLEIFQNVENLMKYTNASPFTHRRLLSSLFSPQSLFSPPSPSPVSSSPSSPSMDRVPGGEREEEGETEAEGDMEKRKFDATGALRDLREMGEIESKKLRVEFAGREVLHFLRFSHQNLTPKKPKNIKFQITPGGNNVYPFEPVFLLRNTLHQHQSLTKKREGKEETPAAKPAETNSGGKTEIATTANVSPAKEGDEATEKMAKEKVKEEEEKERKKGEEEKERKGEKKPSLPYIGRQIEVKGDATQPGLSIPAPITATSPISPNLNFRLRSPLEFITNTFYRINYSMSIPVSSVLSSLLSPPAKVKAVSSHPISPTSLSPSRLKHVIAFLEQYETGKIFFLLVVSYLLSFIIFVAIVRAFTFCTSKAKKKANNANKEFADDNLPSPSNFPAENYDDQSFFYLTDEDDDDDPHYGELHSDNDSHLFDLSDIEPYR